MNVNDTSYSGINQFHVALGPAIFYKRPVPNQIDEANSFTDSMCERGRAPGLKTDKIRE